MLRVKIITVGKLKEKYLREAQQEYLKRLSSYCKAEVCEINEERLPDNPSDSDILRSLDKEADRIIKEGDAPARNLAAALKILQLAVKAR